MVGLFQRYPGACEVKVYALDSKAKLRLRVTVEPTAELMDLLTGWLGEQSVKLV